MINLGVDLNDPEQNVWEVSLIIETGSIPLHHSTKGRPED